MTFWEYYAVIAGVVALLCLMGIESELTAIRRELQDQRRPRP